MKDFIYHNPVQIHFGTGILEDLGQQAARYGDRACIVTSRYFRDSAVRAQIEKLLNEAGVRTVVFAGVTPNPMLASVKEGLDICKQNGVNVLVALGGGSVIDCAKAIGFSFFETGDLWDFFTGKRSAKKSLPLICIGTVAASGSEMNANCVITNEQTQQKYATRFDCCYPKASYVDISLHRSLPPYNTACGMVDTITHVLERYHDGTGETPLQDRFAEGIVHTVIENEAVLQRPDDLVLRKNQALCALYALNGICDAGRGGGNLNAHTIELDLSARVHIAHGAGMAIIHPAWMRHLCKKQPGKFAEFARRIFSIEDGAGEYATGIRGIDALQALYVKWGMPKTLKEAGLARDDLLPMAERIVASPRGAALDKEEVYKVLCDCYA